MSKQIRSPKEVALWRLEQIDELLVEGIGRAEKAGLIKRISKTPLLWPSGQTQRPSPPTLYRWVAAYKEGGLDALIPKRRSDLGNKRSELPDEVVHEALRLLAEDPGITLTFLLALLQPAFPEVRIARSTLYDRLCAQAEYKRIKRANKSSRRRGRFVAAKPHDIWQCDAKEKVSVVFSNGVRALVYILTILDDATRAVLAAIVSMRLNLAAATRVFRMAAMRYGLPKSFYADRASIFDSHAFRMGLASLGDHRIWVKPKNPQVRGKIEAYHRTLTLWFTERLPQQNVVDIDHLQKLLDGVLYGLYQPHKHRGLNTSPEKALAYQVSSRQIPPTRLVDAFRQERKLKSHRTPGEVEIARITYLVPEELRGQRLVFRIDPATEYPPLVEHPTSGKPIPLRRAAIKPEDLPHVDVPSREPAKHSRAGNLQTIYDNWQGKKRPQAAPGFGLPEIYTLMAKASRRHVPQNAAEGELIQRVYPAVGPLPRLPTELAFDAIGRELGSGRPIKTYLDALEERFQAATIHEEEKNKCPR